MHGPAPDRLLYGDRVIFALGKLPDVRALDAVKEVLEWPVETTPGFFHRAAVTAAIELHAQAGIAGIVDLLERIETRARKGKIENRYEHEGMIKWEGDPLADSARSCTVGHQEAHPVSAHSWDTSIGGGDTASE